MLSDAEDLKKRIQKLEIEAYEILTKLTLYRFS